MGIDLSGKCIESCKSRFGNVSHAQFLMNDGMSLDPLPDDTFDLVFSFDSLVHAEAEVLDSYIRQMLQKLAPQGIAFVHHSNVPVRARPEPNDRQVRIGPCPCCRDHQLGLLDPVCVGRS
jgi:SAM-dependent methyltransferase